MRIQLVTGPRIMGAGPSTGIALVSNSVGYKIHDIAATLGGRLPRIALVGNDVIFGTGTDSIPPDADTAPRPVRNGSAVPVLDGAAEKWALTPAPPAGRLQSPSLFDEGPAMAWPRKDRGGRRRADPLDVHSLIEWTVLACNLIRFSQLGYSLVARLVEARRNKRGPRKLE